MKLQRHALQAFKFCIGYLHEVVGFGIRAPTRQRQGRSNSGKPLLVGEQDKN
jgi:hypothetical protein